MRKRGEPLTGDARKMRIIIVLVVAGWLLALALMGVAAVFWDRQ